MKVQGTEIIRRVAAVLAMIASLASGPSVAAPPAVAAAGLKLEGAIVGHAALKDLACHLSRRAGAEGLEEVLLITDGEFRALRHDLLAMKTSLAGLRTAAQALRREAGCRGAGSAPPMAKDAAIEEFGAIGASLTALGDLIATLQPSVALQGELFEVDPLSLAAIFVGTGAEVTGHCTDARSSRPRIRHASLNPLPPASSSPLSVAFQETGKELLGVSQCVVALPEDSAAEKARKKAATARLKDLQARLEAQRKVLGEKAARLFRAEQLDTFVTTGDATKKGVLLVKAVLAGGTTRSTTAFFVGPRVRHSGGVLLTHALLRADGDLLLADTVAAYLGPVSHRQLRTVAPEEREAALARVLTLPATEPSPAPPPSVPERTRWRRGLP